MSRLYLVRHGEAAAGWHQDADPGLSDRGKQQAKAVAAQLASLGPLPVITSPLRRTQETASPLAATWGVEPRIDPAVGEIPSPSDDLAERGKWLMRLFGLHWEDWPEEQKQWRRRIPETLAAIGESGDAVVFSHYVFINAAADDDAYHPDYCSVTVLDDLKVVELGAERETRIL